MSKQVALAVSGRAGTGKGEARSLRRAGRVPAVAYGAALDAPIPVRTRSCAWTSTATPSSPSCVRSSATPCAGR
jgi:ribosomal protein L25 (general stress protein Ctc)